MFTFLILSIVGLEMYKGVFHYSCFKLDEFGNRTNQLYFDEPGTGIWSKITSEVAFSLCFVSELQNHVNMGAIRPVQRKPFPALPP